MLIAEDLTIGQRGQPTAVRRASLRVDKGEIVGIIGSNGSGKSEVVQGIVGLLPILSGTVHFEGRAIHRLAAHRIAKSGVSFVPEGRHIFTGLSVAENLQVPTARAKRRSLDEEIWERFPVLQRYWRQSASSLSGGEQQQLAIARALVTDPKAIILDEPSAGLSPVLVEAVYSILHDLKKDKGILVVEQLANLILPWADRIYVMRAGQIVFEGVPDDVSEPDRLRDLYLGAGG